MLCPLGITFAPLWCAAVIFLSAFSLGCSIWLMRFYSGWWILGLCYHSLFYVAETYTALAGYSQTFLVGTSPGSASAFSPSSSRFDSTFGLASQCRPLVQPCCSSSPPEGAQDGNSWPRPEEDQACALEMCGVQNYHQRQRRKMFTLLGLVASSYGYYLDPTSASPLCFGFELRTEHSLQQLLLNGQVGSGMPSLRSNLVRRSKPPSPLPPGSALDPKAPRLFLLRKPLPPRPLLIPDWP